MNNVLQALTIAELDIQLTEAKREIERLQEENEELTEAMQKAQDLACELRQEIELRKAGRPVVYGAEFKNRVREYYDAGHTHRETAAHFNISRTTVGKFLAN